MQAPIPCLVALIAAQIFAGSAGADPVSRASATITIVVPPFAEALDAEERGASGAWTVKSEGRGFMVGITPDAGDADDAADRLTVLSGVLSRVDVQLLGRADPTRLEGRVAEAQGSLKTFVYSLPRSGPENTPSETRLLFSAI